MADARYFRYDGSDPLAPPVDVRAALDAIGADVLAGSSPRAALRELLRRGMKGTRGLDDLAARAQRRRRELLNRHNVAGTLDEVRKLLDEAVLTERKELARALDDDARFAELTLAELPKSTAGAVSELADYQWRSPQAKQQYDKIGELLGKELLDSRFQGIKQALEGATEEDRARVTAMLAALNQLLAEYRSGADVSAQFREFMGEFGDFFPEQPRNVEELIEILARRAAAAQRLRNSLTPEQRAELDALAAQAFGSPELMSQLDMLDRQLRSARSDLDWDSAERFRGEEGLGLGEAVAAMNELSELDEIAEQLSQQYSGAQLDDVDIDAIARLLGDEAAADVRTLRELDRALRREGYLDRDSQGQWRLSPKALRRLGEVALRDITGGLGAGNRMSRSRGAVGEPTGADRAWEFGDTSSWDVPRTITNAVLRAPERGLSGGAVRIELEDVAVAETEQRTQAVVALLVDTSFSMVMDDHWVPMKRTALALAELIATRFRGDKLQIIGFGRSARTLEVAELAGLDGVWEQGTNLHHALLLAGQHLRRYPNARPVVLVVTDGEPTAHLEADGEAVFDYPPSPRTIGLTVRELDAIARLRAHVTFFRLGEHPSLARFIDRIAKRVGGTVVAPESSALGAAVVGDYLRTRWWRAG